MCVFVCVLSCVKDVTVVTGCVMLCTEDLQHDGQVYSTLFSMYFCADFRPIQSFVRRTHLFFVFTAM